VNELTALVTGVSHTHLLGCVNHLNNLIMLFFPLYLVYSRVIFTFVLLFSVGVVCY